MEVENKVGEMNVRNTPSEIIEPTTKNVFTLRFVKGGKILTKYPA